jgi:hypothetical protein
MVVKRHGRRRRRSTGGEFVVCLTEDRKSSAKDSLSAFLGGSDSNDVSWSGLELDDPLVEDFGC